MRRFSFLWWGLRTGVEPAAEDSGSRYHRIMMRTEPRGRPETDSADRRAIDRWSNEGGASR
jgi:hypothetical protein